MSGDVAQSAHPTLLGDQSWARLVQRLCRHRGKSTDLETPRTQGGLQAIDGHVRLLGAKSLLRRSVAKGCECALTNVLPPCAGLSKHFWRVADHAETGGDEHEHHHQQKPRRVVDPKKVKSGEDFGPEGPELVDVIDRGGILAHDGANRACDTDDRQGGNCKSHGTKKFDHLPEPCRADCEFKPSRARAPLGDGLRSCVEGTGY